MNKIIIFTCLVPVFLTSCSIWRVTQYPKEEYKEIQYKIDIHEITFSGGDGSSPEKAIIIIGPKNENEILIAEQLYVKSKIENNKNKICSQSEVGNYGNKYDLVEVKNENSIKSFYFDNKELIGQLRDNETKKHMEKQLLIVQNKINNNEIFFSGGDGSTIEKAIIIMGAKTDEEGVISEQIYLTNKIGIVGQEWHMVSQAEIGNKGKMYDLIEIKNLNENRKESYYFDISGCFGKM